MDFVFSALRVIGLIFLVLLVFNLMILVHEWGHFLAARWRGLKVEKFYVWFGKAIWKKKINGVEYGLGSIPMGGYVALPQMAPMDAIEGKTEEGREALPKISPLDKIIVAFAGPLFSFLLAAFFAVLVWWAGTPVHEIDVTTRIGYVKPGAPADRDGLKPGDKILDIDGKPVRGFRGLVDSVTWHVVSSQGERIEFRVERPGVPEPLKISVKPEKPPETTGQSGGWRSIFTRPAFRQVGVGPEHFMRVTSFIGDEPNNPAQEAGVKKGDMLISLDGQRLWSASVLADLLESRVGKEVTLGIVRDGKPMDLKITPRLPDQRDAKWVLVKRSDKDANEIEIDNRMDTLGIQGLEVGGEPRTSHPTPGAQLKDAGLTIVRTLEAITSPKSDLGVTHLSGAIGIANVYYNLLQDPDGWRRVLWFSVVLNVNLALLNLLPFPVLDGGHIVMALYEWIRRKSINLRLLEVVQTACVLLLLGFMVFISFKDVGDVFRVGRKGETEEKAPETPTKFLAPDKRAAP